MDYIVQTNYRACTLRIDIEAQKACEIQLRVKDSSQPNTVLTDRSRQFRDGEQSSFFVQMPITGKAVRAEITPVTFSSIVDPSAARVIKCVLLPLPTLLDVIDYSNKNVRAFLPFAQRFCFNAGVLPTYRERLYTNYSENKIVRAIQRTKGEPQFFIRYMDTILTENGERHVTPAQIQIDDKIINVARDKFIDIPVPGRMCILLHEFSHLFVNDDMYNEAEADLNAVIMYMGLGYPVIEIHEMYLDTFNKAQTQENFDRYSKIKKFVDDFIALQNES